MNKNLSFYDQEGLCEHLFQEQGPFWHICTPENHPVLFSGDSDYRIAVNALGISALMIPSIRVITFQAMSNHLHELVSGPLDDCLKQIEIAKKLIKNGFVAVGRTVDFSGFTPKPFAVDSLSYLRNTIAYINRNAYVVNVGETPFSSLWGANRFFFNPDLVQCHKALQQPAGVRQLRELTHSRIADRASSVFLVNGVVTPTCFCDFACGESVFRNARNYFSSISRAIESHKDIARMIGEAIFYSDDDLFVILRKVLQDQYNGRDVMVLTTDEKTVLAKLFHYDYNAGNRQIARLVKLDIRVINQLFPLSAR